jgi:hypothetical protein
MQVESQKRAATTEQGRAARDRGSHGPVIRPTDLVEGVWTAQGGHRRAEVPAVNALEGRNSRARRQKGCR